MHRIVHSRFKYGKPVRKGQDYDRVVTSCWSYHPSTQILIYGATVFNKDNSKTFWNRKKHRDTAIQRYEESPVYVKLEQTPLFTMYNKGPRNVAIDWHIATDFIFKFRTHVPSANILNMKIYVVDDFFNHKFSYLKYKPIELKYTEDQVVSLLEQYKNESRNKDDNYDIYGWLFIVASCSIALGAIGSFIFLH